MIYPKANPSRKWFRNFFYEIEGKRKQFHIRQKSDSRLALSTIRAGCVLSNPKLIVKFIEVHNFLCTVYDVYVE